MLSKFVNSNTASSSNSGSLLSNTVTIPKEDLKGITTRSGIAYNGPTILTSSPRAAERRTEVTKDTIFPTNNGITQDVQPPVVPVENQNPVSEPVNAPVSAPMPNPKPSIPYPTSILTVNPSPPLNQGNYLPEIRKELKLCEAKTAKSSIEEPPQVELKDLPPHLEYAFFEDNYQGINLEFCSHKILMEEDYEPTVKHQRRVNPKIHDFIKKEVEKLLDAGLIYPISDSLV
ncbi:hypothetical protein Tco_0530033 [Tanacetum coccineum]